MRKDNCEQAFPVSSGGIGENFQKGMTLRQWYAGLAMQGMLASCERMVKPVPIEAIAEMAFDQAQAMIEESGKRL